MNSPFISNDLPNITHLGNNLLKMEKSKLVLEKNLGSLTFQMAEVT